MTSHINKKILSIFFSLLLFWYFLINHTTSILINSSKQNKHKAQVQIKKWNRFKYLSQLSKHELTDTTNSKINLKRRLSIKHDIKNQKLHFINNKSKL